MRFHNLQESSYKDVFSDQFDIFIDDYRNELSSDLFVVFSDNPELIFDITTKGNKIPSGMYCFPIKTVIKNPAKYTQFSDHDYLYVVRAKKKSLNIQNISYSDINKLCKSLSIDSETMDQFIKDVEDTLLNKKLLFPYSFMRILRSEVEDGIISKEKVDSTVMSKRLRNIDINIISDKSNKPSGSLLSSKYSSLAIMLNAGVYTEVDKYDLRKKDTQYEIPAENDEEKIAATNTIDPTVREKYFRDKETIGELASLIAEAMDTEINNDIPYSDFLDFYFWTVDGIQIRITSTFGSKRTSDYDDIYYVVECKTPFGILIHSSRTDETFEEIAKEVGKIYNGMSTAIDNWEPRNRDVFMMGHKRKYRLLDDQKDDIVKTVDHYYPSLYSYARIYKIFIPVAGYFNDYEKLFINDLIELFIRRKEKSMVHFIERLEETNFNFDNLLFDRLPEKITINLIKKIAKVYDIAKSKFPNRKGWYLFKEA